MEYRSWADEMFLTVEDNYHTDKWIWLDCAYHVNSNYIDYLEKTNAQLEDIIEELR